MSSTCSSSMGAAPRRFLGACAMLMAIIVGVANAASGNAASVVVGLAKCGDCSRKNMNAEAAFKGLKVVIKCKNSNGEYESKAVGELQSSGTFSVPFSVDHDHHGADCLAQLHSAAGTPCPGQEPSRITPLADDTFVAIPGKTQRPTAECASVTILSPMKLHFLDHYHKKTEAPQPKPEPKPEPQYGSPTPINNHPPADESSSSHKNHDLHHFFDHFHKKPVPPKPEPEPKPQPENKPPTPVYGTPTPSDGSSTPTGHAPTMFDHFHKGHHHFFDHFHMNPVPPEPKPQPQPQPEYHPPTPPSVSPTPIYHPPANH